MPDQSLILSYMDLRRAVGLIGISLPVVLTLGNYLLGDSGIEPTMSAYYYTAMGDVFVGALFAVAVFLMSYRGWDKLDELVGDLAGAGAIGVALFPVMPETSIPSLTDKVCDFLHAGFAALFFLSLAYFCLVLFRKSEPDRTPTAKKLKRNKVYLACGCIIVACVALIGIQHFVLQSATAASYKLIFWFESIAIIAFGVSWFVKGEGMLKDD
ncbi:MAG: DUF998 domain-containing protein [Pseudomonadales bacterium]